MSARAPWHRSCASPEHALGQREGREAIARLAERNDIDILELLSAAMSRVHQLAEAQPPGTTAHLRLTILAAGIASRLLPFTHRKLAPLKPEAPATSTLWDHLTFEQLLQLANAAGVNVDPPFRKRRG